MVKSLLEPTVFVYSTDNTWNLLKEQIIKLSPTYVRSTSGVERSLEIKYIQINEFNIADDIHECPYCCLILFKDVEKAALADFMERIEEICSIIRDKEYEKMIIVRFILIYEREMNRSSVESELEKLLEGNDFEYYCFKIENKGIKRKFIEEFFNNSFDIAEILSERNKYTIDNIQYDENIEPKENYNRILKSLYYYAIVGENDYILEALDKVNDTVDLDQELSIRSYQKTEYLNIEYLKMSNLDEITFFSTVDKPVDTFYDFSLKCMLYSMYCYKMIERELERPPDICRTDFIYRFIVSNYVKQMHKIEKLESSSRARIYEWFFRLYEIVRKLDENEISYEYIICLYVYILYKMSNDNSLRGNAISNKIAEGYECLYNYYKRNDMRRCALVTFMRSAESHSKIQQDDVRRLAYEILKNYSNVQLVPYIDGGKILEMHKSNGLLILKSLQSNTSLHDEKCVDGTTVKQLIDEKGVTIVSNFCKEHQIGKLFSAKILTQTPICISDKMSINVKILSLFSVCLQADSIKLSLRETVGVKERDLTFRAGKLKINSGDEITLRYIKARRLGVDSRDKSTLQHTKEEKCKCGIYKPYKLHIKCGEEKFCTRFPDNEPTIRFVESEDGYRIENGDNDKKPFDECDIKVFVRTDSKIAMIEAKSPIEFTILRVVFKNGKKEVKPDLDDLPIKVSMIPWCSLFVLKEIPEMARIYMECANKKISEIRDYSVQLIGPSKRQNLIPVAPFTPVVKCEQSV